jgi:predicted transcriptional regulator
VFENALSQYECHSREGGHGWEKARLPRAHTHAQNARLLRVQLRARAAGCVQRPASSRPSKIAALLPFKTEEAVRQHFLTLEVRQAVAQGHRVRAGSHRLCAE